MPKVFMAITLTLLLTLPGQAEGLVLCLTHDGGMAIEMGCEGVACCGAAHSHGKDHRELPGSHTDDECSCTDIPLSTGLQVEAVSTRSTADATAVPQPAQSLTQCLLPLSEGLRSTALPPRHCPEPPSTPVTQSIRMLL